MEINVCQIEQLTNPNTFKTICQKLHDFSQQLIRANKNKIINNLSDEELDALKTLTRNKDIIRCKADKGNAIVIMDRKDYIEKCHTVLNNRQFKETNKSLIKEKEKKLNKYSRTLYNNKIINQHLFYQLHSICTSPSVFYGQSKTHKNDYPIRPIISTVGTYNDNLSKYMAKIIKN